MAMLIAVFFLPSAFAWYLLRKEAMPHAALMLLYAGAMVVAAYYAGKLFVLTGDSGEETVHNVFKAYGEHGGSIPLAIVGVVLGGMAGQYAYENDW